MCRSSAGSLGPPQAPTHILFGFYCILELFGISSQQFYIGTSYTKVWVLGFLSERILEDWVILGPHGNSGLVLRGSYCLLHILSMPAQPLSLFPSVPGPHRHWRPRPWTQISGSHTPSGHSRFPLTPMGCEHPRHRRPSSDLSSFSLEEGRLFNQGSNLMP